MPGKCQSLTALEAVPCRYVNAELPGWLRLSGEERVRFEDTGGIGFKDVANSYLLQRLRMNLDAKPVGYVEIGNSEADSVSLRAGRQGLAFGEGRLVADPNWSNVGRSFDGVRMVLRFKRVRLDAFSGAFDQIYTDGVSAPVPGEHFDGLYGSLDKSFPAPRSNPICSGKWSTTSQVN